MKIKTLALVVIACMTITFCPYGWTQSTQAKIPFAFMIGEKKLPAGTYTFQVDSSNPGKVKLTNQTSNAVAEAIVQTRLAQISESLTDVHLVFDKMDEDCFLAEFWLPGQDGYFLGGTGLPHTHVLIHGTMRR